MPVHVVELISEAFKKHRLEFRESTITILGIAYSIDSDDTRNTPAMHIISLLKARNTKDRLMIHILESMMVFL